MDAGRLLGHEEALADLAVGRSGDHQLEDLQLARREIEGDRLGSGVGAGGLGGGEVEAPARGESLDLRAQPLGAELADNRQRVGERSRGGRAVAVLELGLRLAPERDGPRIRALDRRPGDRRVAPQLRIVGAESAGELGLGVGAVGALDRARPFLGGGSRSSARNSARSRASCQASSSPMSQERTAASASTARPATAMTAIRAPSSLQNWIRSMPRVAAARPDSSWPPRRSSSASSEASTAMYCGSSESRRSSRARSMSARASSWSDSRASVSCARRRCALAREIAEKAISVASISCSALAQSPRSKLISATFRRTHPSARKNGRSPSSSWTRGDSLARHGEPLATAAHEVK